MIKTRANAEDTIQESSHATSGELVIDDQPVVLGASERRPLGGPDDPIRTMRGALRRWKLLVFFVLVGAALGWLSAAMAAEADTAPIEVDHYQARHVVVLDANVPDTQIALSLRNLSPLAKRVTVGEVPDRVADQVGVTPTAAATQVRIVIRSDSESMDIITVGTTPAIAEQLADAYAAELFSYLRAEASQYAADAVDSAQSRLDEAEGNLARVRRDLAEARLAEDERAIALLEQDEQQFLSARIYANAALLDARADGVPVVPLETLKAASGSATIISSTRFDELVNLASRGQNIELLFGDEVESSSAAGGALSAVSSRLPRGELPRVGAGAGLGLLLGLMVVAALNRLDTRVRSKRQVEDQLDLPVVAEVPTVKRRERRAKILLSRDKPRSRFAEQHRGLASTVTYARRARPWTDRQVVLVTSPGPAEGKTTTVANLGAMLAEAGERVLLVNCDFRRPKLHLQLGVDDTPMSVIETTVPNIDIVTNVVVDSEAAPTEVVAAQRRLIERARQIYDLIIIDTAPLLATNDAVDLLELVDDVILVLRAGKTSMHAADRAAELLERRRTHVLGVALSDIDAKSADDYYYYGGYYYESPKPKRSRWWRRDRSDAPDGAESGGPADSESLPAAIVDAPAEGAETPGDPERRQLSTIASELFAGDLIVLGAEPDPSTSPAGDSEAVALDRDHAQIRLIDVDLGTGEALEVERRRLEAARLQAEREQRLELERRAQQRRQADLEHKAELLRIENERRAIERARRTMPGRSSPPAS